MKPPPAGVVTVELVRVKVRSAASVLAETQERIRERDPELNCFTAKTFDRAEREAAAIDGGDGGFEVRRAQQEALQQARTEREHEDQHAQAVRANDLGVVARVLERFRLG